jgi:hypothetical protein
MNEIRHFEKRGRKCFSPAFGCFKVEIILLPKEEYLKFLSKRGGLGRGG